MPQQPPRLVKTPDGVTHQFPAEATDAEISEALEPTVREDLGKRTTIPHPTVAKLLDWLPAAGGAAGGIIGGIGGTAFGLGIGGVPGAVGGAALLGAAGEAGKQLINRAIGNTAPETPTEAADQIRNQAVLQGGMELVGGMAGPVLKRTGAALMQSAVKPGLKTTARALAKGVGPEDLPVVKTLLNEGVNVSPGGIAKLNRIISASNDEIKTAIQSLPGSVSPQRVATRTQALAQRMATQVNPRADVAAVKGATKEFLMNPKTTQIGQVGTKMVPTGVLNAAGQMGQRAVPVMGRVSRDISLPEAQALKTGTYRELSEKAYGELKAPAIEAQKALARGLKEEIEAEAMKSGVNLSTLNAREGAAIVGKEAIAKRVAAAGNRDPVALAWLAHNPTAGLLFILERSPAVKSMLARGLYQSASVASKVPPNVLRTIVTALASYDNAQEREQQQEPQ